MLQLADRLCRKHFSTVANYLARPNGCHASLKDLAQKFLSPYLTESKVFSGRVNRQDLLIGIARNIGREQHRIGPMPKSAKLWMLEG